MKRVNFDPASRPALTIWEELLHGELLTDKQTVLNRIQQNLVNADQKIFYPLTVKILKQLKYNAFVGNQGDTNNRIDAFIKDQSNSIPIEIKSPTEVMNVNIKSIQQAVENKIILLSRHFYPTNVETTSLVVGYHYPEERSGVYELIKDVKYTYGFNIGFITMIDLLDCLWEQEFNSIAFNKNRVIHLEGKFQ